MAKSSKSGLGRGLNSLLGGAYEEAIPIEVAPKRVLVGQEDRDVARVPAPPIEKSVFEESQSSFGTQEEESIVDNGASVTIKSVVQRHTDEVPIDTISPNPDQPRNNLQKEVHEELASSIEKDGLLIR